MACLAEFGTLDEQQLFNYDNYMPIVELLIGMHLFAVLEQQNSPAGVSLSGYDKSFFSKKLKGSLSLTYIHDVAPHTNGFMYDDGQTLPPFADILIGMNFWSEYAGMQSREFSYTYRLGSPRRQVLSYGVLLHTLQMQWRAYTDIIHGNMVGGGFAGIGAGMAQKQRAMVNKATDLLDVFIKYQPQSRLPKVDDHV